MDLDGTFSFIQFYNFSSLFYFLYLFYLLFDLCFLLQLKFSEIEQLLEYSEDRRTQDAIPENPKVAVLRVRLWKVSNYWGGDSSHMLSLDSKQEEGDFLSPSLPPFLVVLLKFMTAELEEKVPVVVLAVSFSLPMTGWGGCWEQRGSSTRILPDWTV